VCIVAAFLSAAINNYVLIYIRQAIADNWQLMSRLYSADTSIWLSLLAGLRGGITIGGFAAAIKLMKYWYIKEQRNLQLQKENTESQLQLLKAQVHPHFLFNTLNNIYSHTQATAPVASQLVMGLSDMLRYMLYECRQDKVPLSKELKMLQDYMTLEKIRYGNQLDLNIDLPQHSENLVIAPLLLLPFAENAFKHGSSHIIEQPWISLSVTIDEKVIRLKVVNGKASAHKLPEATSGIGISNVRKRLELIYPNKHVLEITDEEDVFIVNLKIELDKAASPKEKPALHAQPAYA
jgi:LytS/YehU family sensor histidine kinase